ncbi:MAG TPA: transposase [Usitatibacter sp.]|nr:transposase [Usitatibacter sp.]
MPTASASPSWRPMTLCGSTAAHPAAATEKNNQKLVSDTNFNTRSCKREPDLTVDGFMPRLPRHFPPSLPVHLVHRGNNRQPVFLSESDFLAFRHFLGEACAKHRVALHAYVLMPNHVHMLVTPEAAGGVSKFMQSIARRYVGYFNSFYRRSGTLWEGRFHASVIESDRYLLACHRYIDMNPVRAGLVTDPADYAWSSHRHYCGAGVDSLLTRHCLLDGVPPGPWGRAGTYGGLFLSTHDDRDLEAIRVATQTRRPLREHQLRT